MDRVAKATEQSEKHLAKMAAKEEKKQNQQSEPAKKEEAVDKSGDADGLVVKELKQHTRYLRSLSGKGLGATFT